MKHETPQIAIGTRCIGIGHPTYVIAELSANHRQDFGLARELVHLAKASGADAVKLQTYTPDTMTLDSDQDCFQIGGGTPWEGKSLYDLYGEASTPWAWHEPLKQLAEAEGLDFLSTPFDPSAVAFLDALDVAVYKVASFELVDLDLIRLVASMGKPMILSTGMATVGEIDTAVSAARQGGASDVALLRCNSAYPAAPDEMDLRTIPHMAGLWGVPIGLSDHTLGVTAVVVAVSLGACIVEKHLTLSRAEPGPDSAFSAEPEEFRVLVDAVREAEQVQGSIRYGPSTSEIASLGFRRSLFVVEPVRAGEEFTNENVRAIRPNSGLAPGYLDVVLGRRSTRDVGPGTPLTWELLGARVENEEPSRTPPL